MPFVPEGRANMVGWMAASSDPGQYPKVTAYRFPQTMTVEGPGQVFSRINSDQNFSKDRSLLSQTGSNLVFGDFQVIPIEDTFLYVQPAYVVASGDNPIPELKFVLLVNGSGGDVSQGATLAEALSKAVGGIVPPDNNGGQGTLAQKIQNLLNDALDHFQKADEALSNGDLGTYQDELTQAQDLVQRANDLAASRAGGGGGTPTGNATSSPSPSPSGSSAPPSP